MKWAIYWVFISPLMEDVVTPANDWTGMDHSYSSYKECMLVANEEADSFKLLAEQKIEKRRFEFEKPLYKHIGDHMTVECRKVGDADLT